jgi:hypothetical protein
MKTRRILSIIATLVFTCGLAGADTVKLKTGETFKGNIIAEDATSVTIEFAVEGTKGIKDERRFEKSEIESYQKEDPADKAWADLTKEIPTADLMGTSDYDLLIAKVDAFVAAHGKSTRAAEARRLLAALKEERAQVAAGGLKLDGTWISPEQYQREKFWVDGRAGIKQMSDLGKAGRRLEALRIFEKLEATHAGTTLHAKAIAEVGPILKGYGVSLAEAIRNHSAYMGQRAKVLTTLAPEERRKTEALQASEVTAHKAKIEAERKSGTKWLSMAAFDLEELKKAAELVDKETKRLAAIDTNEFSATDGVLRQVDQAVQEGRVDVAKSLLAQISSRAPTVPYIKELQDRLKIAEEEAAALKKAADEARAAAERAQRQANPAPVNAGQAGEPDPVKEGMNPVAKAVAESDLGKRVAGESTPPPPEENAPAPPAGEPASPATAGESPAATETPKPSSKPAAGKSMTPVLYVVAGILVLALIGLLVLPSLKKKPEENSSVLDHHKKPEPPEGAGEEEIDPQDPEARA